MATWTSRRPALLRCARPLFIFSATGERVWGLRECLKTAHIAEANSIELLGSGLTEAGIGFAASLHLFSTLDFILPLELNAPVFLESMVAHGIEIRDAVAIIPDQPGLGILPDEDYIIENQIHF